MATFKELLNKTLKTNLIVIQNYKTKTADNDSDEGDTADTLEKIFKDVSKRLNSDEFKEKVLKQIKQGELAKFNDDGLKCKITPANFVTALICIYKDKDLNLDEDWFIKDTKVEEKNKIFKQVSKAQPGFFKKLCNIKIEDQIIKIIIEI